MRSIVVVLLLLAGGILQTLGYTGTCTQNDTDSSLVGTLLSAPLLLAGSALIWSLRPTTSALSGVGLVTAAVTAVGIAIAHRDVWIETLVLLGSPCGPSYFPRGEVDQEHLAIGLVYGPAWLLVAAQAAFAVRRTLPKLA